MRIKTFCSKSSLFLCLFLCALHPGTSSGDENQCISTTLKANYRVEVDNNGNTSTEQARIGYYNNIYYRTWAEFDISTLSFLLEGKKITDVGFRVYNDWGGNEITSLRYTSIRPSLSPSSLTSQHTYANKYNGFDWEINSNDSWTPDSENFFQPGEENWNTWVRTNDGVTSKSILEDLTSHISGGKEWFAVEFDCYGSNCSTRSNLRFSDNYTNPESIVMQVTMCSEGSISRSENLGTCSE